MKKAQSSSSAPREDTEVRLENGPSVKRQQQILRICTGAKDQQALLTEEKLAEISGTDVRTIRRDIQILNRQQICIPTLGQQKDIDPGVTHRVKAVYCYCKTRNH